MADLGGGFAGTGISGKTSSPLLYVWTFAK